MVVGWYRLHHHSNAQIPLYDVRVALAMGTTYHNHYICIRLHKNRNIEGEEKTKQKKKKFTQMVCWTTATGYGLWNSFQWNVLLCWFDVNRLVYIYYIMQVQTRNVVSFADARPIVDDSERLCRTHCKSMIRLFCMWRNKWKRREKNQIRWHSMNNGRWLSKRFLLC